MFSITSTELALYVSLLTVAVVFIGAISFLLGEIFGAVAEHMAARKFNRELAKNTIQRRYNKSVRRASGLTDKEYLFKHGSQSL